MTAGKKFYNIVPQFGPNHAGEGEDLP